MAAHLRSQIFDAVKALLVAIPEFSGAGKVARGRTAADAHSSAARHCPDMG